MTTTRVWPFDRPDLTKLVTDNLTPSFTNPFQWEHNDAPQIKSSKIAKAVEHALSFKIGRSFSEPSIDQDAIKQKIGEKTKAGAIIVAIEQHHNKILFVIKCVKCGNPRTCHKQDLFQVKHCLECRKRICAGNKTKFLQRVKRGTVHARS